MTTSTEASLDRPRPCGSCNLCCKIFFVEELNKPANTWCAHVAFGKGCKIHETRPATCRDYQCAWTRDPLLEEKWRPDNAHFVMVRRDNELTIIADPSFPDAWRREPYYSLFKSVAARKSRPFTLVLVRARNRVMVLFPETEIDIGPNRPDMTIYSGYHQHEGKRVPYAHFGRATPSVQNEI